MPGYATETAGMQAGDEILKMNGHRIHFFKEVSVYSFFHAGETVEVTFLRDGEKMTASVNPDKSINIEIFPSPINQIPPPIMNRQKRTSNDLTRPPIILHKNCNEIPLFPISFI